MPEPQLSEIHDSLGADTTEFAGWEMPLKYEGIIAEHNAVRNAVGLFDVSHMGELMVSGGDALDLIQKLTTKDASKLDRGSGHYTIVSNQNGGVRDDVLVYRTGDREYLIIVNASNVEKIHGWFVDHAEGEVAVEDLTRETIMLALQGPKAENLLRMATEFDLEEVGRFGCRWMEVLGEETLVSRSGYTGEDGFELYVFDQTRRGYDFAERLWKKFMEVGEGAGIKPCGLGARDSLRLEAGLPLYGNDLTEETTPLEAKLSFTVSFDKGDFIGREALLKQKEEGISRLRTGLRMEERGVPRKGHHIIIDGESVGEVTSGGFSPVLERGIAMGYAPPELEPGDEVQIEIRGEGREAVVEDWPFHEE